MVNVVTPSGRPFVIASIMLATFMAAIEGTIVATAMPSIVGQLGGFTYYSWVFSAFLLAQSTTTVVYGKLSDLFGRKPTLIIGIVLMLIGSLLCGFAWSMTSLVAFRLLQGLGAGAIYPITITVIGDLYKLEERGRVQGMMASVWAVSGVLGPLAGGRADPNLRVAIEAFRPPVNRQPLSPGPAQLQAAPPQGWLQEAQRLADQGKVAAAMQYCQHNLREAPSAEAFYLVGLLHDAVDESEQARAHYRKALYLEPTHREALVHLAEALIRDGDAIEAQRLFDRAKRLQAADGLRHE